MVDEIRAGRNRLRDLSTDELHQAHDLLERLLNADELTQEDLRRLRDLLKSEDSR